jgi:hypothetical protein
MVNLVELVVRGSERPGFNEVQAYFKGLTTDGENGLEITVTTRVETATERLFADLDWLIREEVAKALRSKASA